METDPQQQKPPEILAQQLSHRFERFIAGAVATAYRLDPRNLTVLHDLSFKGETEPDLYCFRVLDSANNLLYGVVANLQEDMLCNYRVGMVSM